MKSAVLPIITFGLFAMVIADRLSDVLASATREAVAHEPAEVSPDTLSLRAPGVPVRPAGTASSSVGAAPSATPTIDRLARLATRQQLAREAGGTYLDSLMANTDSLVRRWPDRNGVALRVFVVEGGPADYRPKMAGFVQEALSRWENTGMGVRFDLVSDSTDAHITVRWIDHFSFDRAGQTDLTWDQLGRVRGALISLALRTNTGFALPDDALLAVAVHEAGHALGLPHSADSNDVMFPATRTGTLSDRDQRTAQVLYQLQPGPVRDVVGTP